MQACLGHRETWSLAFQLRMFVPCDMQLHLPASLWYVVDIAARTSFARFANINADHTHRCQID
jgi:hypothetical protein